MSRETQLLRAQLLIEAAELLDESENEVEIPRKVLGIIIQTTDYSLFDKKDLEGKLTDKELQGQVDILKKFEEKYKNNMDDFEKTAIKALYDTFNARNTHEDAFYGKGIHGKINKMRFSKFDKQVLGEFKDLSWEEFYKKCANRVDYKIFVSTLSFQCKGKRKIKNPFIDVSYMHKLHARLDISKSGTVSIDKIWEDNSNK